VSASWWPTNLPLTWRSVWVWGETAVGSRAGGLLPLIKIHTGMYVEEEETGEGDWMEPGKITIRRKRDKNSPRRMEIPHIKFRPWYMTES